MIYGKELWFTVESLFVEFMSLINALTATAYRPRRISFLELWEDRGWRMKISGIACNGLSPRTELVQAAKKVAQERIEQIPVGQDNYKVGFIGVHDGKTSNFVFVDWWADENELHHHVYVSPTDQPAQLTYATPTGLCACVWDLSLMAFEREAWLRTILQNPSGPDLEAYLSDTMKVNSFC